MASYPWILKYPDLGIDIADFPNVQRWFEQVAERPATKLAYAKGADINTVPTVTEESRRFLLGQDASTIAR